PRGWTRPALLMRFIAFEHVSGVGKDTCADIVTTMLRNRGISCVRGGFADKLKEQCFELYGWAGLKPAKFYNSRREERYKQLPEIGLTPVEIWIQHGEKVRLVYPHAWSNYL